jgi:hypothetical protein
MKPTVTAWAWKSTQTRLESGSGGRPARPGRRPADRNEWGDTAKSRVGLGSNRLCRSVRRVAGRNRPVACAIQIRVCHQTLRHDRQTRPVRGSLQHRSPCGKARSESPLPFARFTVTKEWTARCSSRESGSLPGSAGYRPALRFTQPVSPAFWSVGLEFRNSATSRRVCLSKGVKARSPSRDCGRLQPARTPENAAGQVAEARNEV